MGTRWSALLHAPPAADITALEAALARAVDRTDRQMSTWKPDSDLMRLNAASPGAWVSLPPELMKVLVRGLEIGRISAGAFDIGVGGLVNAWGFGAAGSVADKEAIQAALRERLPPTHTVLELDAPGARARKHAQFGLDLSGIAKGFAVDEMMRTVKAFGIPSVLVGLDGELKASGTKPDGTPWLVAVEKPDYGLRSPLGVVELRDAAVATSGDYRHWIKIGGTRLCHTMDRLRGGPIDNAIASVSVVASSCMDADAWATALMVLGPTEGKALAEKHGLDSLLVVRGDGRLDQIRIGAVFQAASTESAWVPQQERASAG
ncbi:MAG: FAD:protein FMN transferase [Hyphomicrobiaceae bacterium]